MMINDQLKELYNTKYTELIKNANPYIEDILNKNGVSIKTDIVFTLKNKTNKRNKEDIRKYKSIPANPLLIKVDEEKFYKSDIKVMIFGQETFGWHELGVSIENEMNSYHSFFNNNNKKFVSYDGNKRSSLWKGFRWFASKIEEVYDKKNIYFVWNNISKIGRYVNKAGVPKNIKDLENKYFSKIIKEEIKIIKPDIVIFLTGNRDKDIKDNFDEVEFEDIKGLATLKSKSGKIKYKAVQKVISKDLEGIHCIKLYHPSFFGGFNNVKQDVIDYIKLTKLE